MKIGLFGGSFDPIHKGHVAIAKRAIADLNLDKLIFIPTYINPFKNKMPVDPIHRINMIKLCLEDKMEISTFEVDRKGKSYTFETIKYFKHKHPNDELFLIIGSDNLPKLHKWEYIDFIAKNSKMCVYKRSKNINKINIKRFNMKLINNDIYEQSSTNYRKGDLSCVNKNVQEYIGKNKLYIEALVNSSASYWRAKHGHYAGEFARKIAKAHNFDSQKAYVAAIFHDIAKEWDEEKSKKFIKRYYGNINVQPHEYHQLCGAAWAKNVYLIDDDEIVEAIKKHTTMALELNWLDKCVFIADKICRGRKYPGIEKIRKLVLNDFDEGFKAVVNHEYENVKDKLSEQGIKIYEKWM
ncbi:nicotinate-nucleotide adenylyltransferase [Mycoplasma phocimorsus]|uniref:nicotinate-nucleotide adenylyltransferase n=1 Tax=Mycoplasma phocimorsus TaxID=3045839 RepID=UPI0024C06203|nr:nicotinate-nucleotide adenylyltransferase [Mycoplasma phocimorsus]MDJ1647873.1 nicotinate-nucleotide adenylyltransferase [Mycoplasma phocimorsus]